jgi:hypothetical protein
MSHPAPGADALGGRILKYDKVTGESRGEFPVKLPNALAVGKDGRVWVGHEHKCVSVFDPDGNPWTCTADEPAVKEGLGRGKFVKLEDTIRSFREVLDGKHDDLPEQAFYLVGGIDDVLAEAEKLAASTAA